MVAADVIWWDPAAPPARGPVAHRSTQQEPPAGTVEEAQRWAEAFPAAHPEVRVESATIYLPDGVERVGFYNRKTKTWRWI